MTAVNSRQLMPVKVRRWHPAHCWSQFPQLEAVMTVHTLEKTERHSYFDRMTKVLIGKRAEIEVASSNWAIRSRLSGWRCWHHLRSQKRCSGDRS